MQVDVIIDRALGAPHGNWEGLSYGELALVYIVYVVMKCSHYLSPVAEWVAQQPVSLHQAPGKPVGVQDCTDDRLALLLGRLGDEQTHPGEQIELELGTLDPVGLPLASAVLSGEQADDPHYTPA